MFYEAGQRVALEALGLTKLSTVNKLLKQYRRALKALESGEAAFHGTKKPTPSYNAMTSVLESGNVLPSRTGQYGPGVYWWAKEPRRINLNRPTNEGVITALKDVEKHHEYPLQSIATGEIEPTQAVRLFKGPGKKGLDPFPLKPKDTAIAHRTPEREPGFREHHLRQIEPHIFNRARADLKAKRLVNEGLGLTASDIKEPSVKELRKIVSSKTPPSWKRDPETFVDQNYDEVVEPLLPIAAE